MLNQRKHWGVVASITIVLVVFIAMPSLAQHKLTLGTWVALDRFYELYTAQLEEFERANPDIELEIISFAGQGEYTTNLVLRAVTNDLPDVIMIPPEQAAPIINAGIVQDLTPYYERIDDMDMWFPVSREAVKFGGITFGVPAWFVNYTYVYNRDYFDQHGLVYPAVDEWVTWDYIRDTARKLTIFNPDGTTARYGYFHGQAYVDFLPLLFQAGGHVFDENMLVDLDHEPTYIALDWLNSLVQEGIHGGSRTQFYAGGVATMRMGSNQMDMAINSDYNFGVTSGTQLDGRKDEVVYLTTYGMTRGARDPEIAWRFLQFIPSRESQIHVVNRGRVPTRRDVAVEDNDELRDLLVGFMQSITHARPYPYHVHSNHIQTTFNQAIRPLWTGAAPARSLIPQIQQALNAMIADLSN